MDVIALHQAGFTNAVAALGTSFTAEHARLIARYASEVVLTFDADAAGQKGTRRAIDLLRETGVRIRVVRVPDGKDPDEFIKKNGAERFRALIDGASNDLEYRMLELGRQVDMSTTDGRSRYLQAVAKLLAGVDSVIERDVYAGRLAAETGVSKSALLQEIGAAEKKRARQQMRQELSQAVRQSEGTLRQVNPEAANHPRAARAEEALLGLLLRNPDLIASTAQKLSAAEFATGFNRQLYERLVYRQQQGLMVDLALLAADYDVDAVAYITRMERDAQTRDNTLDEVERCVQVIQQEHRAASVREGSVSDEQLAAYLKQLREDKK